MIERASNDHVDFWRFESWKLASRAIALVVDDVHYSGERAFDLRVSGDLFHDDADPVAAHEALNPP